MRPSKEGGYRSQIVFVKDRPGHDRRYAIDASRLDQELDWRPEEAFETGLKKTIAWYLDNEEWAAQIRSGGYRLERQGLS